MTNQIIIEQCYNNILDKISDSSITANDFDQLIQMCWVESHPKGVRERIFRKTRKARVNLNVDRPLDARDKITPKYKSSKTGTSRYDPRKTADGKRSADKTGREDEFKEAVEFISNHYKKPLTECVKSLSTINNFENLKLLVSRMISTDKFDRDWTYNLYQLLTVANV